MRNAWLVALLAACTGGSATEDWQPVQYVDEGEVCFTQSGQDLVATVTAPDCMSSSCSRAFEGSCVLSVTGTDITLTSDLHWEDNVADGGTCTDAAGSRRRAAPARPARR
ncbi:MAG: hypothetical protein R3F59_10055 [Myxococcota bacterium]